MSKKKLAIDVFSYIFLGALLLLTVYPLVYAFFSSLKTNAEIVAKPAMLFSENSSLDNFKKILNSEDFNLPLLLFNSLWYTVISTLISVFQATTIAYAFVRGNFKFKKQLYAMMMALLFIKAGGVSIYATFDVLSWVNAPHNLWTLIVMSLFGMPVIYILLVRGYMESIPNEIYEAAKIDGASFMGVFFKIVFPLLKPIIATIAIMSFNGTWNSYLMPMVFTLNRPEQRTLIVALMSLQSSSGAATSWDIMFAGTVVAIIPVLIIYIIFNKWFVSGLTAGAVKG